MADPKPTLDRPTAGYQITSMPTRQVAVTPSDDTVYAPTINVYVVADGNVVLEDAAGTTITYAMTAGNFAPCRAAKVKAATTATVVGVW